VGARPKLPRPAEATLRLASLVADEALRWPEVSGRPMFGMRALYRGKAIFALLPDKRALGSATAIACKVAGGNPQWRLWELETEEQIGGALVLLERAYGRAGRAGR
jgi:hypothetical protein